jgi:hypothetical protein
VTSENLTLFQVRHFVPSLLQSFHVLLYSHAQRVKTAINTLNDIALNLLSLPKLLYKPSQATKKSLLVIESTIIPLIPDNLSFSYHKTVPTHHSPIKPTSSSKFSTNSLPYVSPILVPLSTVPPERPKFTFKSKSLPPYLSDQESYTASSACTNISNYTEVSCDEEIYEPGRPIEQPLHNDSINKH